MLLPGSLRTPVPGAAADITRDAIVGDQRIVGIRYRGPLPVDGTIATLDLLTLLGRADTATLDIDSASMVVAADGISGTIARRAGFFRTLGICYVGGGRFVRIDPAVRLDRIVPNPVVVTGRFLIELPERGWTTLRLFDHLGREVARMLDGELDSGIHTVTLDASGLPSGAYFCELCSGGQVVRQKVIVGR
jgi:hypothetical protein